MAECVKKISSGAKMEHFEAYSAYGVKALKSSPIYGHSQ